MEMSRRRVFGSIPVLALAGTAAIPRAGALAQDAATPVASPQVPPGESEGVSCAELAGTPVASERDEALLDLLIRTPVSTPLFPADTGTVRPAPWIDECDTDLAGTVGGVLMQAGQDELGNFIGPGVYLVFPGEGAARARLDEQLAGAKEDFEGIETEITPVDVAGHTGLTIGEPDSTVTVVVAGPVIVGGIGDASLPGDPALRSLANALALLDHLRTVMA